jgi:hypothetical protein
MAMTKTATTMAMIMGTTTRTIMIITTTTIAYTRPLLRLVSIKMLPVRT